MTEGNQGSEPQFSADGQWWWTGAEWVPASQVPTPPPPPSRPSDPAAPMPSASAATPPGSSGDSPAGRATLPPVPPTSPPTRGGGVPTWLAIAGLVLCFPVGIGLTLLTRWSGRAKAVAIGVVFALAVVGGIAIAANSSNQPSTLGESSPAANQSAQGSTSATLIAKSPSATAKPLSSPSPRPAIGPITLSGSGQSAPHFTVSSGLSVLTATYAGSGNFAVELLDSNGQAKDVPINVIGSYSGSVGENLDAGSYILKVTADAIWSITITQPRGVVGVSLPKTYSGHGQQFVGPFSAGDAVGIQAQNTAGPDGGNFVVQVLDKGGAIQDIPINEIGSYKGSTVSNNLSDGPFYLNIDSDGTWTVTVSKP